MIGIPPSPHLSPSKARVSCLHVTCKTASLIATGLIFNISVQFKDFKWDSMTCSWKCQLKSLTSCFAYEKKQKEMSMKTRNLSWVHNGGLYLVTDFWLEDQEFDSLCPSIIFTSFQGHSCGTWLKLMLFTFGWYDLKGHKIGWEYNWINKVGICSLKKMFFLRFLMSSLKSFYLDILNMQIFLNSIFISPLSLYFLFWAIHILSQVQLPFTCV